MLISTADSEETARKLAETLVREKLAACVNVIPRVESFYRWEDAVQRDREFLLLVKTTGAMAEAARRRIVELHPYALPEVLEFEAAGGHSEYLAWVVGSVSGVSSPSRR